MSAAMQCLVADRYGLRLTIEQLAEMLGEDKAALYGQISAGTCPVKTYVDGGKRFADYRDAATYAEAMMVKARGRPLDWHMKLDGTQLTAAILEATFGGPMTVAQLAQVLGLEKKALQSKVKTGLAPVRTHVVDGKHMADCLDVAEHFEAMRAQAA